LWSTCGCGGDPAGFAAFASCAPRSKASSIALSAAIVIATAFAVFAPRAAAAETMQSALAKAYENNPQLNAQRAIVRQSDEGVAQALSGYRPTLSASASLGRQYVNTTQIFPAIPGTALTQNITLPLTGTNTVTSVGVTGNQTLFNGQQTANRVRAAESQVFAARETLRMMEESVLLAAATAYMDVLRDTANLEVQQTNVRVLQRTLKDTRNRFDAGQLPPRHRR
jgi:outer membrane protein